MEKLKKEFEQLFTKDATEITSIPKRRLAGNPQELWLWILNNFDAKVSQMQLPVRPEIADEIKKAVQQDRREIIELLENYLLDTNHCFEIEKLKFVNKLSFADLILSIARGLIYGK